MNFRLKRNYYYYLKEEDDVARVFYDWYPVMNVIQIWEIDMFGAEYEVVNRWIAYFILFT